VRCDFDKALLGIDDCLGGPVVARDWRGHFFLVMTEASDKPELFYSRAEFRPLLPSRHGNPLRSMLALICGSDPDGDAKT
jgi:hypothetical protein